MAAAVVPPKLLVVTIDRLPAWILPAWGSTWVATPALDALAGRGVTFDRLIATGDDDLATLRDLGLEGFAGHAAVVTDAAHVADEARRRGAATRLVEPARVVPATDPAATGLARLCAAAVEVVVEARHPVAWVHAAGLGVAWDAPAACREAYADPDDPRPYVNAAVPDLVVDADTDPDFVVGIRQAYAGQLTHLDACLGPLLEAASDRHVLLAGVRGLGLGLHGRIGTGPLPPFGEILHVPAVLVDAAGRMAAQRHAGLVLPADLGATVADLGGLPAAPCPSGEPRQGRSLAGLFADWSAPLRDRIVATTSRGVAIVTPAWQLVAEPGRPPRLFHKPDDYFELCDVADRCPAVVEELAPLAEAAAAGDVGAGWRAALSAAATSPT